MSAVNLLKGLVRTVVTKAEQAGHNIDGADAVFAEIEKLSTLSQDLGGPDALASGKAQRTHDRIIDLLGIDTRALFEAEGPEDLAAVAASMAANVAKRTLVTGPTSLFGEDENLFPTAKRSEGQQMAKCSYFLSSNLGIASLWRVLIAFLSRFGNCVDLAFCRVFKQLPCLFLDFLTEWLGALLLCPFRAILIAIITFSLRVLIILVTTVIDCLEAGSRVCGVDDYSLDAGCGCCGCHSDYRGFARCRGGGCHPVRYGCGCYSGCGSSRGGCNGGGHLVCCKSCNGGCTPYDDLISADRSCGLSRLHNTRGRGFVYASELPLC